MRTKHLSLVYIDAGGGHRAAARALQAVIAAQRRPWSVSLVNLTQVLDPDQQFRRWLGFAPEDVYNRRLARGWTLGLAQELRLLQGMIRLGHPALVRTLQQHWLDTEPDLVVSLVPNFNRALCESLASALPGVPYVTVMTDLGDLPPHFWIEPGLPAHLVCGSERALAQARAAGLPDGQLSLTSGMLLHPDFYRRRVVDRTAERSALGLDPARPTGVVMFGAHGSKQMLSIARALPDVQLLMLCGHHVELAERLRALRRPAPLAAIGFTTDVPRYLQLGDFFIGKPGPGSLSEAVQAGLPVISFDNAWTMPQERYNLRWLEERGVGLAVSALRELPAAVHTLLADLPAWHERVRAVDNRAIFELPEILESLLLRAAVPGAWPAPASAPRRPREAVRRLPALLRP